MNKKIHYGGFGKMFKCEDCGMGQLHFLSDFCLYGVCENCGSQNVIIIIARPRWKATWWGLKTYLPAEERDVG